MIPPFPNHLSATSPATDPLSSEAKEKKTTRSQENQAAAVALLGLQQPSSMKAIGRDIKPAAALFATPLQQGLEIENASKDDDGALNEFLYNTNLEACIHAYGCDEVLLRLSNEIQQIFSAWEQDLDASFLRALDVLADILEIEPIEQALSPEMPLIPPFDEAFQMLQSSLAQKEHQELMEFTKQATGRHTFATLEQRKTIRKTLQMKCAFKLSVLIHLFNDPFKRRRCFKSTQEYRDFFILIFKFYAAVGELAQAKAYAQRIAVCVQHEIHSSLNQEYDHLAQGFEHLISKQQSEQIEESNNIMNVTML